MGELGKMSGNFVRGDLSGLLLQRGQLPPIMLLSILHCISFCMRGFYAALGLVYLNEWLFGMLISIPSAFIVSCFIS